MKHARFLVMVTSLLFGACADETSQGNGNANATLDGGPTGGSSTSGAGAASSPTSGGASSGGTGGAPVRGTGGRTAQGSGGVDASVGGVSAGGAATGGGTANGGATTGGSTGRGGADAGGSVATGGATAGGAPATGGAIAGGTPGTGGRSTDGGSGLDGSSDVSTGSGGTGNDGGTPGDGSIPWTRGFVTLELESNGSYLCSPNSPQDKCTGAIASCDPYLDPFAEGGISWCSFTDLDAWDCFDTKCSWKLPAPNGGITLTFAQPFMSYTYGYVDAPSATSFMCTFYLDYFIGPTWTCKFFVPTDPTVIRIQFSSTPLTGAGVDISSVTF